MTRDAWAEAFLSRTTRLLVLLTAVGLGVTGVACSGEDWASAEGPGDEAAARTAEATARLATVEFSVEMSGRHSESSESDTSAMRSWWARSA